MARRARRVLVGDAAGPSLNETIREERARRLANAAGTARTMLEWSALVPERGLPLNLAAFPFQRAWYSDEIANAREMVLMKAAQIGASAYSWRWAARRAEQFGDSVIYFFPTDDDVSTFGDQRVEPSIESSDFLLSRIPNDFVRQKKLKRIGAGWLSLRGTQSKNSVQSVDADALVFDEYDYLHPGNLAQAERRLAGSKAAGRDPRIRRLGYPTLPGAGIHAIFERSDQRTWLVKCPACDEEQELEWEKNVRWRSDPEGEIRRPGYDDFVRREDVAEAWRCCAFCEASLEGVGGPLYLGRWHARRPESNLIGFQASRLIVPLTDLAQIVVNSRGTSPGELEAFYNNDLGLAYSPTEASLTQEDIDAATSAEEMQGVYRGRGLVVAGLDVASARKLNMWVDLVRPDGSTFCIWAGALEDFEDVAEMMRRLQVAYIAVDHLPETRQARALGATFPGRVILAAYHADEKSQPFEIKTKKNLVIVNRTHAIDAFQDGIRYGRRQLPRSPPRGFHDHLKAPKRRTIEKTDGGTRRAYVSTGPDDYTHAGVYCLTAREVYETLKAAGLAVEQGRGRPVDARRAIPSERFGLDGGYDPGFSGY